MAKAINVARYLVYLKDKDEEDGYYFPLSNLKLQKLLYYCQGGHYRWDNERLITDKLFDVWDYGVAIESVYKHFRKYGRIDIHISEKERNRIKLKDSEKETIKVIWEQLKHKGIFDLVESSKSEIPYRRALENNNMYILEEDIREYFTSSSSKTSSNKPQ